MKTARRQLRWDDPRVEMARHPSSQAPPAAQPSAAAIEPAIRALDLTVRKRIEGLFPGDHRTRLPGLGTELHQLRGYEPGDDVRLIEWNVTARTGEPHVQVHLAERALTTWLVLDVSPSMNFGTAAMRKVEAAEGVALAVGHLATRHGNRLGVVLFGDRDIRVLPPKQGRSGLVAALSAVRRQPAADGTQATSLASGLARVAGLARQRGLVVAVSDFRGETGWEPSLGRLAQRHAVIAVEVADPREESIPDIGEVEFVDPETGAVLRVDTRDRRLRERFAQHARAEHAAILQTFARHGVEHVRCTTEGQWLRQLAEFLRRPGVRA